MRILLLVIAGLCSDAASACTYQGNVGFHVPRDVEPGPRPAAPRIAEPGVARGHTGLRRGYSTSCDDIGWLSFAFIDPPPDGDVGYVFTLVSGHSPTDFFGWPIAARDGRITWSWIDGARADQEPFAFVVNVQTVSATGARSVPVPVTVSHRGTGNLELAEGATFPLPPTLLGDCGIAEAIPSAPLSTEHVACMEQAFRTAESAQRREEASLRLITSAEALPDKTEWARLVRRHLEQVDANAVDLSLELVVYLGGQGPEEAEQTIYLADALLDQSQHWTRETYMTQVYVLNEIRTVAASALFQAAQEASADDSALQTAQERVRVYARQWHQFARMVGKSTQAPLQMCLSAGGSQDWCTSRSGD